MTLNQIQCILFDFGGVLADEGFRAGLHAIADQNGLDREAFFKTATETIYQCGYVTGQAKESEYWRLLRIATGIKGGDDQLRGEILTRFLLRPAMLEVVRRLRSKGYRVGILSDQTDWLDKLEQQHHFFQEFEAVYNSYHVGKSKRDPSLFEQVATDLNVPTKAILFVDDNPANTYRAGKQGMHTHVFTTTEALLASLHQNGLL